MLLWQVGHTVTLDEVLSQQMRKLCSYRIAYRYQTFDTRSGTLQLVRSVKSVPHHHPLSSVIMATQDKHQQAVKENRMVSVQEATIRKAVGYTIFGLTTLRLYTRGIAGMSGTALSFLYAVATTFLITGFHNQCGCSLRLRWAIDDKGRPFKDRTFVPPEHIKFIRGKRQGIIMNFAFSNVFAVSLGVALYTLKGIMSQQHFNALLLGSALHLGIMVFLSYRS